MFPNGLSFNLQSLLVGLLPSVAGVAGQWASGQLAQSQAHHGAITAGTVIAWLVTGLVGGLMHGAANANPPADKVSK